jgi:hypothetical protein
VDPRLESWVSEEQLAPLINAAVTSPTIRHALADAQRAIELPDDTAFYCYRAIESLRHLFVVGDRDDGRARAASWDVMRSTLAIERDDLDWLRLLANERRHGGHIALSEADRRRALTLARRALRLAVRLEVDSAAQTTGN